MSRRLLSRQRGAVLFIALIVLVAMSLTGIALMRSVDTNLLVAGNLAFRQGATAAGDWGVESARSYLKTTLIASQSALDVDNPAAAYYSTWQQALDMRNMLLASELIARSALLRQESRGAHYREDFSQIDNTNWLKNIFLARNGIGLKSWTESVKLHRISL